MHEIVKALEKEAEEDVMRTGAYVLVSESAVNILGPLKRMRKLAEQLRGEMG